MTVPTAEEMFKEFFESFPRYGVYLAEDWKKEILAISKKHTKLHLEAALQSAAQKAYPIKQGFRTRGFDSLNKTNCVVHQGSILNAYPPENIK